MYTIVQMAKMNNLNPEAYLRVAVGSVSSMNP